MFIHVTGLHQSQLTCGHSATVELSPPPGELQWPGDPQSQEAAEDCHNQPQPPHCQLELQTKVHTKVHNHRKGGLLLVESAY